MADNTTELEVLNQIVDVLGGQSGQYETVVPVLQQIKELLAAGITDPEAIAEAVTAWLDEHPEATTTVRDGSITVMKLAQDVIELLDNKADIDGYYSQLTAGRADALTGADSTSQWATRESTGSGAATVRSVQGAAVVFNQMRDVSGFVRDVSRVIAGHVYYFSAISAADADVPSGGYIRWRLYTRSDGALKTLATLQFTESGAHKVATRFTSGYNAVNDGTSDNTEGNLWTYRDNVGGATGTLESMMLIDLTQMFGSGNEPSTVAEFEQMFPESYYPYSAPTLKPVRIAGIASTDANGDALDDVEWTAQELWGAGIYGDMLYSDHKETNVGLVDLGTLTWYKADDLGGAPVYYATLANIAAVANIEVVSVSCAALTGVAASYLYAHPSEMNLVSLNAQRLLWVRHAAADAAAFKTAMQGVMLTYPIATPTTTPISPALPMTYQVEQGGTENIVVPDGEISAAPVLTVAEGESAGELVMDVLACIAAPDGPVATSNHAVNTYLTMGGKLYKVTRAIAVGETITAGTSVAQTTVMDELIALTA